jgi:hypothetical protein
VSWGIEVNWDYPNPAGMAKRVRNCSVASADFGGRTYRATIEYGA